MTTLDDLLPALRAVAEPTRLRLLHVLCRAELTVSEMTSLFGQSQPRVSHHLKTLCDAGLLDRVQEGVSVFHRVPDRGPGRRLVDAVLALVDRDEAVLQRDLVRLDGLKKARLKAARQYFKDHAARWERIRGLYLADQKVEQALLSLVGESRSADFLDVGTGTGHILEQVADRVAHGVGIDVSREMLAIARAHLAARGIAHCHVRLADATDLPFDDDSFDFVSIHHVLHFLDFPERAIGEAARVLRLGGRLAIVDFAPHELQYLREEFAHRHLGLRDADVIAWCRRRGMGNLAVEHFPGVDAGALRRPPVALWTAVKAAAVAADGVPRDARADLSGATPRSGGAPRNETSKG